MDRLRGVSRRLLFLVGGIVFVDTMFFAVLTPLLPDYADKYDLSKAGAESSQAPIRSAPSSAASPAVSPRPGSAGAGQRLPAR